LNAALRAIVGRAAVPQMAIGIIPLGTGNDFAKALDLGEQPEPALDALLKMETIEADIGMLNDRPFANTSAGGFIADVSDAVTEGLKDLTGKLAYIIGGARVLLGTEPFSAQLFVDPDMSAAPGGGGAREPAATMQVQMFAVCNARFIGGGYAIAPDAIIDDGLLDVLVVPRMSTIEFMSVLQRIAAGRDPEHAGVMHFRASSFDLQFDRRARVNTDGELLEAECCRYRVNRKAARFFCGPNPHSISRPVRI
jgi:diacylglycerol kinase (ATP)